MLLVYAALKEYAEFAGVDIYMFVNGAVRSVKRLLKATPNPELCLALALNYSMRAFARYPTIDFERLHYRFLVAIMIAIKFLNDSPYRNTTFAKIIGVGVGFLNELELLFLKLINFECHVDNLREWCYQQLSCGIIGDAVSRVM